MAWFEPNRDGTGICIMCDVSLLLLVLLVLVLLVLETDMDVLLDLLGITFCEFGKVCVHQSLSSCLSYITV